MNSNQSARELSHFAESAMAVKRVIMQHFSMKYDYMNKERPNIYHPSRAGVRADPSIKNASHINRSNSNDDGDDETLHNSSESTPPADDNHQLDDSMNDNGTDIYNINHDDGCNSKLYEVEQRERISDLDSDLSLRKVPATKKQMLSIEEQLNDAVRSLNEHQKQSNAAAAAVAAAAAAAAANRRSQSALKMYATSNGLGSIIEKLSVDDSDTNATIVESPFKKPQVIVKNSGLDANAKNVPSSNIRHEIHDVQQKKPMAINTRNNIRPEENWRYRSNSNSLENKQQTSEWKNFPFFFLRISALKTLIFFVIALTYNPK